MGQSIVTGPGQFNWDISFRQDDEGGRDSGRWPTPVPRGTLQCFQTTLSLPIQVRHSIRAQLSVKSVLPSVAPRFGPIRHEVHFLVGCGFLAAAAPAGKLEATAIMRKRIQTKLTLVLVS